MVIEFLAKEDPRPPEKWQFGGFLYCSKCGHPNSLGQQSRKRYKLGEKQRKLGEEPKCIKCGHGLWTEFDPKYKQGILGSVQKAEEQEDVS